MDENLSDLLVVLALTWVTFCASVVLWMYLKSRELKVMICSVWISILAWCSVCVCVCVCRWFVQVMRPMKQNSIHNHRPLSVTVLHTCVLHNMPKKSFKMLLIQSKKTYMPFSELKIAFWLCCCFWRLAFWQNLYCKSWISWWWCDMSAVYHYGIYSCMFSVEWVVKT